jgi:hypothetical protein
MVFGSAWFGFHIYNNQPTIQSYLLFCYGTFDNQLQLRIHNPYL